MASLPPEQLPIAEQVLRGGIPAVRTALHLEREKAIAEGRAPPNTDQLVAMAESLLPRLKAAEWHDRAEAAAKDVDEISFRDLRSVVAGADSGDDSTRTLATSLREPLIGEWKVAAAMVGGSGQAPRGERVSGRCAWPAVRPNRLPVSIRSSPSGSAKRPGRRWPPTRLRIAGWP